MTTINKSALFGATMLSFGAMTSAHAADIVETAAGAGNFTTLIAAVEAAGLTETLIGEGPFTVFAPNDDAFAKISDSDLETLMMPENLMQLETILKAHVVPGLMSASDITQALTSGEWPNVADVGIQVEDNVVVADTATLAAKIYISDVGSGLYVSADDATMDESRIVTPDIMTDNGIIHVIDTVLTPAG